MPVVTDALSTILRLLGGESEVASWLIEARSIMENYLTFINTSADISTRQPLPADILVLVQETPFTDSQYKEINGLLKKGIFAVIMERDIL